MSPAAFHAFAGTPSRQCAEAFRRASAQVGHLLAVLTFSSVRFAVQLIVPLPDKPF